MVKIAKMRNVSRKKMKLEVPQEKIEMGGLLRKKIEMGGLLREKKQVPCCRGKKSKCLVAEDIKASASLLRKKGK